MYNFFDLSIIPTFLSRFKVRKVLAIGLSNELIMNKIISFCFDNNCLFYSIDPTIKINDLIEDYDNLEDNLKENIKYFNDDSLDVLPELDNFDAVFINDDPNWYTVYNELNLIKKNNVHFPIVFVCNNKYPHKRRDSYINPEKIPKEYKNECYKDLPILYEEDGEVKRTMVKDGFCHAIQKDTPKNGVLTAIEDFLKENSKLKSLEINPLEGVTLIYEPSEVVDIRIGKILEEKGEYDYAITDLSDKFIENDILLRYVTRVNLLKDDLDRVEEFKSEIEDKDNQIKEYEDKIDLQDTKIKYKDSKINNIESQISLRETKLQSAEAKLLNKNNEIKAKENELFSKNEEIKFKEEELNSITSQLQIKENELETTKNRLINLEANFLDNKKELENVKKELSKLENNELETEINSLKQELSLKDAQLKTKNRRINSLKNKIEDTDEDYSKELINQDAKIKNPESKNISRKILSPLSYVYIIGKSKPSEIGTNIKLYKALESNDCFDEKYYLDKYPDIAKSKWNKYFSPQLHYVCKGFDENREFNAKSFNTKSKKELLEDIKNK